MGSTTPNMSIYVPAAGETNYDMAFSAGMTNIDQHDHSGPPNKGVPISTAGIAANSITYALLNNNVIAPGGGLQFVTPTTQNQIEVAGVLIGIFGLSTNGFIARTGATTASALTLTGTAGNIAVTNGTGGGNPVFSFDATGFYLPTVTQPLNVLSVNASGQVANFEKDWNGVTYINVTNSTGTTHGIAAIALTTDTYQGSINAVSVNNTDAPQFAGCLAFNFPSGYIYQLNGANFDFYGASNGYPIMRFNTIGFYPLTTDLDIGSVGANWRNIYLVNNPIVSSDAKMKNSITFLNYGINLIEKLIPSQFKINGSEDIKWGLIAQDVEKAFSDLGIECSALVNPAKTDPSSTDTMSLSYEQFIPVCIKAIQELWEEVKVLKGIK